MTLPLPSAEDLLKQFGELVENQLSTRAQFRELYEQFLKIPIFRRATKSDPLRRAVEEMLMVVNVDAQGVVSLNGVPMTVKAMCQAIGVRGDVSTTTRVGKILSDMGYSKIPRSRALPAFFRAPKGTR